MINKTVEFIIDETAIISETERKSGTAPINQVRTVHYDIEAETFQRFRSLCNEIADHLKDMLRAKEVSYSLDREPYTFEERIKESGHI